MIRRAAGLKRVLSGVVLICFAIGGCSEPTMVETLLNNMSPEFESIALSHEQRIIRHARAIDTNGRQLWDDLDNVFLLDRPLRLSPYPIP